MVLGSTSHESAAVGTSSLSPGAIIGPGSYIGMESVLLGTPYDQTIVATEKVTAVIISAAILPSVLSSDIMFELTLDAKAQHANTHSLRSGTVRSESSGSLQVCSTSASDHGSAMDKGGNVLQDKHVSDQITEEKGEVDVQTLCKQHINIANADIEFLEKFPVEFRSIHTDLRIADEIAAGSSYSSSSSSSSRLKSHTNTTTTLTGLWNGILQDTDSTTIWNPIQEKKCWSVDSHSLKHVSPSKPEAVQYTKKTSIGAQFISSTRSSTSIHRGKRGSLSQKVAEKQKRDLEVDTMEVQRVIDNTAASPRHSSMWYATLWNVL